MKDNFSGHADEYARFRPGYPSSFFQYLQTILPAKKRAWDCGTGNGQVATALASFFTQVEATDISQPQLHNAAQAPNIHYSVQPAEQTHFPDRYFDLIIVAQAIHWFDFEKFYHEVNRTGKHGGVFVVLGYGRIEISQELDVIIADFYTNIIGSYWDKERKYIDEHYQTIPFPFEEIAAPAFVNTLSWKVEHLIGYLNTWSAVKHFENKNGYNPVDTIETPIRNAWGNEIYRDVHFPLLLRAGKIA